VNNQNNSPLNDIKVLDVSRILAGPSCTQLLGDYGADIVKVERPGTGDDTRKWGPPYVTDEAGKESTESAYYLSANRNKRSITIDMSKPEGQELVRKLAVESDIFIENFKVGGAKKLGIDYDTLKAINPRLIYCSITGFGQTGPYAPRPGYDFMIQSMGGIMSLTGPTDGDPFKVGVGIADLMCGMYACSAILSAMHHREKSGKGQYIDVALFDSQIAWLVNSAQNYLTSGKEPQRYGNGHPSIVPYEIFPSSDGHFALAVGNDGQFKALCRVIGHPEIAEDEKYSTNRHRVHNRKQLISILRKILVEQTTDHWLEKCEANGIPSSPVNSVKQVFDDPQVAARDMKISMPHPDAGGLDIDLIGNPVKFSETPVSYRRAPPKMGQHTDEILQEVLGLSEIEIQKYRNQEII